MTDCPFTLLASLILLYHFQTGGKGTPQTTAEDVASSSRHRDSINLTDGHVNFMFIYLTNSFWSLHILMCRPNSDVEILASVMLSPIPKLVSNLWSQIDF